MDMVKGECKNTLQVLKTSDESSFKYSGRPARAAVLAAVMSFLSCCTNTDKVCMGNIRISCSHSTSM